MRPELLQRATSIVDMAMEKDDVAMELSDSRCGLPEFGGLSAKATFGDGKQLFTVRCRSSYSMELCGSVSDSLWEGQDLTSELSIESDSDFCTNLLDLVGRYRQEKSDAPSSPKVASLLASVDQTVANKP